MARPNGQETGLGQEVLGLILDWDNDFLHPLLTLLAGQTQFPGCCSLIFEFKRLRRLRASDLFANLNIALLRVREKQLQ